MFGKVTPRSAPDKLHERVSGPFVLSQSKGGRAIYRAGAKRLRNLNSVLVKPHDSVLQLHHSQWRQDHVPRDFRPLAEFILSDAEGIGVTY